MPPVLDPNRSLVDGLAFLGLSLSRNTDDNVVMDNTIADSVGTETDRCHRSITKKATDILDHQGHPATVTRQNAFDLNEVIDRNYTYVFSTNDDGWLVGGGEPGPPLSYKLAAPDSAHVEIMRIGTYRAEWGGISVEDIVQALQSGKILIPQVEVVPTAVVANRDQPPELEIRFDMLPDISPVTTSHLRTKLPTVGSNDNAEVAVVGSTSDLAESISRLPVNWQLRFIHNQLFRYFQAPSRFCPGAFHSTILRKAEFRSPEARRAFFDKCRHVIQRWRLISGPQPLVPPSDYHPENEEHAQDSVVVVKCNGEPIPNEPTYHDAYRSGIYLFTDRNTITHRFLPNFLPPYDTPAKRHIIDNILSEKWSESTMAWIPATDFITMEQASVAASESRKLASLHIDTNPSSEEKKDDDENVDINNIQDDGFFARLLRPSDPAVNGCWSMTPANKTTNDLSSTPSAIETK
jgi:hypothetical protein